MKVYRFLYAACLSLWERCPKGVERVFHSQSRLMACQLSQRESQVYVTKTYAFLQLAGAGMYVILSLDM